MPTCAKCGQENPEQARFCLACGSPLAAPEPPPEEERKVVTALFTDIVGSTATAEQLDPEDVRARLSPYYARLRKELESFGGTVEKFIGDAVVAVFGAPLAHEDDPERAVRAALSIHRAIEELNAEDAWLDLHVRTAVHTGEALVVPAANASAGEALAAGDVMNTAARIQSAAPPDGIVVGDATFRATRHLFEYRPGGPVKAKGKAAPIAVWEVVREKARPQRPAARTELVGRAPDLELLVQVWNGVEAEGRPRLATVLGPAGIGKTRLLAAFCDRVQKRARAHWGRCLPYGEGMTYWPVAEILKDAAGILQDDEAETGALKVGALLEALPVDDEGELRTMAAALANVVGAPTTPLGTYSATEITQAELHWGIRRVFDLLASRQPLVLVFEDLHWAEPTLLELINDLADGGRDAPILVVANARPELEETQPGFVTASDRRHVLRLEALTEDESRAVLTELLGGGAVAAPALERLLANAAGNPLFLEEIGGMVADAAQDDETAVADLPIPDTLSALIGARLDALPGMEKRVAQQASVVGAVFWEGAVAHLDGANGDLRSSLEALARRDFVHARSDSTVVGEREYAFKHVLIRDVAYERLPKGRRAELHIRFSDWLGGLPGPEDEFVEILAYHLEQACRHARSVARSPVEPPVAQAVEALQRSADRARRREGIREARRFYERALELVDAADERALDLRYHHARTLVALGDLGAAGKQLLEVADDALGVRPDVRCRALIALAEIDYWQGRGGESRRRLTEAQAVAAEIGDRGLEAQALYELANAQAWFDGDAQAAADDLVHGLTIAEELDDRALRIKGHMRLGVLFFNLGRLTDAEEHLVRCSRLASEMGSFRDEARANSFLGIVRYYLGQVEEAEDLAHQALAWLERISDSSLQLQNLRALAIYALARDQPQVAEERLREALPLALEVGGWLVVEIYRYLAEALIGQGRSDEARELVEFAGRNVPDEDRYAQAALRIAQAQVAAIEGERAKSKTLFHEALQLLETQQLLLDLGDARIKFARALRRLGDLDDARMQLVQAREELEPMAARAFLGQIERELAEITEGAGQADPLRSR